MELLILGMLLGAGAAKRKSVTKALAKGYMAVAETSAHVREDMRSAIDDARVEQEREQSSARMTDTDVDGDGVVL